MVGSLHLDEQRHIAHCNITGCILLILISNINKTFQINARNQGFAAVRCSKSPRTRLANELNFSLQMFCVEKHFPVVWKNLLLMCKMIAF